MEKNNLLILKIGFHRRNPIYYFYSCPFSSLRKDRLLTQLVILPAPRVKKMSPLLQLVFKNLLNETWSSIYSTFWVSFVVKDFIRVLLSNPSSWGSPAAKTGAIPRISAPSKHFLKSLNNDLSLENLCGWCTTIILPFVIALAAEMTASISTGWCA